MNIKDAEEVLGCCFLQWGAAENREFASALEVEDLTDDKAVRIARQCKEHLTDEVRKAVEEAA